MSAAGAKELGWPLALRLAWREFRGGLRGLYVLVACVALGVAATVGVGGIEDAIVAALDGHGRELLGGDFAVSRMHVRARDGELAWLRQQGSLSEVATLRAMARTAGAATDTKAHQALVELKAVDASYPLAGVLTLHGGGGLADAIGRPGTAVCDPLLLDRLGLKIGDRLRIGNADITLTATIVSEPDKLTGQALYGPRLLMSMATLETTGLAGPGSLVRWQYKIANQGPEAVGRDGDLLAVPQRVAQQLPASGFQAATRLDPIPGARRAVERLSQFLTLVGLTTLAIGGLGVANAVAAHLLRKRKTIATLRSLGASDARIFSIYLAQILLLTLAGISIGMALGAGVPGLVVMVTGQIAPVEVHTVFKPMTFLSAGLYGLLVALLFVLWPLGRAEQVTAAALFRSDPSPVSVFPRWPYVAASAIVALSLVGLMLAQASDRLLALSSAGGLMLVLMVLLLAGWLVERGIGRLPRFGPPQLRLALGNIAGAQSLARPVMLSLGCGLGLLSALVLIDHSLEVELLGGTPANAPDYFLLDVGQAQLGDLKALFDRVAPGATIEAAPLLRGRVVSMAGVAVESLHPPREVEWFLQGDRGLTFADAMPDNTTLSAGSWWPRDYAGPPLLSLDEEIAKGFGLGVGDAVVVNVLGREIETHLANLRQVTWQRLAINFTMIISPEPLRRAPHTLMATASYRAPLSPDSEGQLLQAIAETFANIAAIRVRDGLELAASIIGKVVMAVRVAALVTLGAGTLVLGGAMTAARRRRSHQAVVLKVLGATSGRVIAMGVIEHGVLALAASVVAILLGTLSAWLVLHYAMDVPFVFSSAAVLSAVLSALSLVMTLGAFGTYQLLRTRPMPHLRAQ